MDLRGKKFSLGSFSGEVDTYLPEKNAFLVKFNGVDVMEIDAATVINLILQRDREVAEAEEASQVPPTPALTREPSLESFDRSAAANTTPLAPAAASLLSNSCQRVPDISLLAANALNSNLSLLNREFQAGQQSQNTGVAPNPTLQGAWPSLGSMYK